MEVKSIPLNQIMIADNMRLNLDEEKITELAESIKYQGLINPITVMPFDDEKYVIISGHRRYYAFKKLGLPEIPTIIKKVENELDRILHQIYENEKRQDLSYYERAIAYLKIFQQYHIQNFKEEFTIQELLKEILKENGKYDEVIALLGKSKKTLYRIIYPLSNPVMERFYREFNLSPNVFEKIASLKNSKNLEKILEKIVKNNMTLSQVENEIKKQKKKETKENLYKINSFIHYLQKIKNNEIKLSDEEKEEFKQKIKELKEILHDLLVEK